MTRHRFAVIGKPIAHSLSPIIHQLFAQQMKIELTYEKILGDEINFEQQVRDFFAAAGAGLNITLPFKERAFALATEHSNLCLQAGAANTLWIKQGQINAENTDGIGLIRDLSSAINVTDKNILILGAGGAVRGILGPLLAEKPASIVVANRTRAKAEALRLDFPQIICADLSQLTGTFELIINATSASLDGTLVTIPEHCFAIKPFCYDLAYHAHKPTAFVAFAKSQGCKARDGLGMLVEQAAQAFRVWHGLMPATEPVLVQLRKELGDLI
ncbi:MAG: shikimate dehydrogenase, partial [Legionella sp.]